MKLKILSTCLLKSPMNRENPIGSYITDLKMIQLRFFTSFVNATQKRMNFLSLAKSNFIEWGITADCLVNLPTVYMGLNQKHFGSCSVRTRCFLLPGLNVHL